MEDTMNDDTKQAVLKQLKPEQMVFLATSMNDQPYVMPVTLIYNKERFFFATGADDAKTAQISANPLVEICLYFRNEENAGYVRFTGKANYVTEEAVRKEIFDETSFMNYHWKEPADPAYILFRMNWHFADYMKPGDMYTTKINWT